MSLYDDEERAYARAARARREEREWEEETQAIADARDAEYRAAMQAACDEWAAQAEAEAYRHPMDCECAACFAPEPYSPHCECERCLPEDEPTAAERRAGEEAAEMAHRREHGAGSL